MTSASTHRSLLREDSSPNLLHTVPKKPPADDKHEIKSIARNKRARFDYHILETFEAGLVLQGTEVKSLREGKAKLATGPADVLAELGWPIPVAPPVDDASHSAAPASNQSGKRPDTDTEIIDATGAKLWRLLDERTPAHVDDLALRAQIPAREALGKLAELELKGIVVQRPGKYFLRR